MQTEALRARPHTEPGTDVLRVDDLGVTFGGLDALRGVSLRVHAEEIVAVVGPNGAGKTTLFNAISGLVMPSSGTVHLDGRSLDRCDPAQRAAAGLGRTFQQGGLWLSETARTNLLIAQHLTVKSGSPTALLALGSGQRARERERGLVADEVLRILGLSAAAHQQVCELTYGDRRVLELGCALIAHPFLLMLDEPAAGLSTDESAWLATVIASIREQLGISILLIEHHVPLVTRVADTLYVLDMGVLVTSGDPHQVTSDPRVLEAYLGTGALDATADVGAAAVSDGALFEMRGLHAGYGGEDVLHGIDLSLTAGSFTVVLGANGAGKSTMLRSVMGLTPKATGTITFGGQRIDGRSAAAVVRRGIALVPEGRQLFPNLTVKENLLAGALAGGRRHHEREALDQVFSYFPRCAERRDQIASTLSGGEQQMVAIGRALMSRPRLLLVDEASLGLAPIIIESLFDLIASISRDGVTVLAVEQSVAIIDRADAVVVLEQGSLVFGGPVDEVKDELQREVISAYLGAEDRPSKNRNNKEVS